MALRTLKKGDILKTGTKLYFNFPDNLNTTIALGDPTPSAGFFSIIQTKESDSFLAQGIWLFRGEHTAEANEYKIALVEEGLTTDIEEFYRYNKDTQETEFKLLSYTLKQDLGPIVGIKNFSSASAEEDQLILDTVYNCITVDEETLGNNFEKKGNIYFKYNEEYKKIRPIIKEEVPLKGSIFSGPIKWSAVDYAYECVDEHKLYFVMKDINNMTVSTNLTLYPSSVDVIYNMNNYNLIGKLEIGTSKISITPDTTDVKTIPIELPTKANTVAFGFENSSLQRSTGGGIPSLEYDVFFQVIDYSERNDNILASWTNTLDMSPDGILPNYSELKRVDYNQELYPTIYDALIAPVQGGYERRIALTISAGSLACLTEDTKIKTNIGDVYIEELELDDLVYDKDNLLTKIIKTYSHKTNSIYQIKLSDNSIIECTFDHKFIKQNGEKVIAENLKINDYLTDNIFIKDIKNIKEEKHVYEIKTESNTYQLYNGIVCECENI